ncbi:MAG TPA: lipid A biosynthesis palmitoleoyl acyltransferase, partial [Franconibacter pulveris]|nr:lipid A biosynthesis palmitoleoyl acyltransferase [Franconibacter pulveris]
MNKTGHFSSSLLHPRYLLTWCGLGLLWLLVQLTYPLLMRSGPFLGEKARTLL